MLWFCLEDMFYYHRSIALWWLLLTPCHKIQHLILFLHQLLIFLISFIIFLACHRMSEAPFSYLYPGYLDIIMRSYFILSFQGFLYKYVPLSSVCVQYCPNKNGPLIYPAWAWEGRVRMPSCPIFCHLIKSLSDAG